jgi:protein-disulfide isomerase-like protein with CxxC motif
MDERRAIKALLQARARKINDVDTIHEVDRPINSSGRDVLKAGVTLMIAALWGSGPALTQEKRIDGH